MIRHLLYWVIALSLLFFTVDGYRHRQIGPTQQGDEWYWRQDGHISAEMHRATEEEIKGWYVVWIPRTGDQAIFSNYADTTAFVDRKAKP